MRLSKASYFADFAVYPPAVLALLILALRHAPFLVWIEWSIACLAGVAAWTLVEYVIHRGVLHGIRFFAAMHDMHHEDPQGFVGTPTWLSLAAICFGALLPLWWETGFDFASGATAGPDAGLCLVCRHPPRAPSLAHSPGLVSLSLEASPRAPSLRASPVQLWRDHSFLGSCIRHHRPGAVT